MSSDPEYDTRLQARLKLLQQALADGKVSFAENVADDAEASLLAVRTNPDGSANLSTVDVRVRALALAIEGLDTRDRVKSANSLGDVTEAYFRHMNLEFGKFYESVVAKGASIHEAAIHFASDEESRRHVLEIIPDFVAQQQEFWEAAADSVTYHLQDFRGLKSVYGGDLFPASDGVTVRTSSIYADTVVLPDPFLQAAHIFERSDDRSKAYYFFKSALNLCSVARLALANLETPIVTILPHPGSLSESRRDFLRFEMVRVGLLHAERLFGRMFDDEADVTEFVKSLSDVSKLEAALVDPSRLLFDTEYIEPLEQQIERYKKAVRIPVPRMTPGEFVWLHCKSRSGQASDLLYKSRELGGVPLVDAPTSWKHFLWHLEYTSEAGPRGDRLVDEHVLRAIEGPAAWLGDVPEEAIIEIRRSGALEDVRERLSAGIQQIVDRDPADFDGSRSRVFHNIDQWFDEHQRQLKEMEKDKLAFAGIELTRGIVYGAISIASAIGTSGLSLVNTFIEQTGGTPHLGSLSEKYKALQNRALAHRNSVAGMLFAKRPT
jgi:hypothetical protein